ncbi:MAG: hypothetical protein HC772_01830 [Leptolyngbyaceae cyanobacterium CRU_2_3]|nr:hypothetical protein [Leptolyngbyaceae cyanobacterium CRU_2_3]
MATGSISGSLDDLVGNNGCDAALVKAETDAIAPASAWIVVIISIGAVIKAWAPIISPRLPYENAKAWAMGLLLIWLWATVLTVGLGFLETNAVNWHRAIAASTDVD